MSVIKQIFCTTLTIVLLVCCFHAAAEIDVSWFPDVWIENDGFGTLTVFSDGTAFMQYYDDTMTESKWAVTEYGPRFTEGEWVDLTVELLEDDSLSIAGGWLLFTRESAVQSAQPLDAVPVGEEGEPFLGAWMLKTLSFGGEAYDAELFGMDMEVTFNADGTVVTSESGISSTSVWCVENGAAVVDGLSLTINEEEQLIMQEDEESFMIFVRGAGESGEEPSEEEHLATLLALLASMDLEEAPAADLSEELQGFVGTWHMVYIATGGLTGDLRAMGVNCTLTLYADGTGSIDFPAYEEAAWYDDEGVVRFGEAGMPLTLLEDGFLQYGSTMGGCMIFSQDAEAVYTPAATHPAATQAPAEVPAARTFEQPTDYLDIKFVANAYTMANQTYDASVLGAEYSLLFQENGTCDFIMAGAALPDLSWGLNSVSIGLSKTDAFVINYYGMTFNAIPTSTGFDLDYYGTMTLHFVPAE